MKDPAESNSVRSAFYAVFAHLFAAPPDAGFYDRLRAGGFGRLAAAQGLDLTSDLVDEADAESCAAELHAEYDRLFGAVALTASSYRAGTGDPAVAVAAFLREHRLQLEVGGDLPADHLSVALGVMGALAAEAEAAPRRRDGAAARTAARRSRAFLA
ncbi:MAG: molecular chaperone, partial [Planctomycetota bacterium]